MNKELIVSEYGDPSRLMESMREETERRIEEIKEQTRNEIMKAERECAEEIESFREAQKRETDKAIRIAVTIMKNRAAIEKRKLHLNGVEDFIQSMIKEAVSDFIMNNTKGYLSFLKKMVIDTLSGAMGSGILVHLCPGDAALEGEIRGAIIRDSAYRGSIDFIIDTAQSSGGVILESKEEGVSYNLSMERIISRKYDTIRKEVLAIVKKNIETDR